MTTEQKMRTAQTVKSAAIAPLPASALVATVGLGVVGWAVTVHTYERDGHGRRHHARAPSPSSCRCGSR